MKLTLEIRNEKYAAENTEVVELSEAIALFECLLKASGYSFNGHLDLVED